MKKAIGEKIKNQANNKNPQSKKKADLIWLSRLARLMDNSLQIPGTTFRFGLDPILGLVPVVGDFVSVFVSTIVFYYAYKYKAGGGLYIRIIINILVDFIIGAVPLLGDLFDAAYRSNARNLRLLEEYIRANDNLDLVETIKLSENKGRENKTSGSSGNNFSGSNQDINPKLDDEKINLAMGWGLAFLLLLIVIFVFIFLLKVLGL